ncbi:unnamed protein product [Musa hybrid cultivar]
MGLKHGTLRRSGSSPLPTQEEAPVARRTLAELFIPRCLRVDNNSKEEDGEEMAGRERKPTLEEWLLSSPGLELDSVVASGSQHRRHSPKVCPLSPALPYEHLYSTPRHSSATDEGRISFSRSESQKKRSDDHSGCHAEHQNMKEEGAEDRKYPDDRGYGGYPGRGGGYYGGYPGRGGGYNGGYPGRGGGGYCRWGCCRRGYYGGCRCCSFPGEVPDAEYQAEPGN